MLLAQSARLYREIPSVQKSQPHISKGKIWPCGCRWGGLPGSQTPLARNWITSRQPWPCILLIIISCGFTRHCGLLRQWKQGWLTACGQFLIFWKRQIRTLPKCINSFRRNYDSKGARIAPIPQFDRHSDHWEKSGYPANLEYWGAAVNFAVIKINNLYDLIRTITPAIPYSVFSRQMPNGSDIIRK